MTNHFKNENLPQETFLRHFTHITIPAEIWLRRDISIQAKALWAELRSLHDPVKGGCYASDEYLMEFIQLQRRRLYQLYDELKKAGLMEVIYFDGRRAIRRAIVPEVDYGSAQEKCTNVHNGSAQSCTGPVHNSALYPYIEKKEENKDKNSIAQSTHSAAPIRAKSAEISFSQDKKEFENITASDLQAWKELYPCIDIQRELMEMKQWILANPTKARSKKLWRKFIVGWLQRSNEKSTNRLAYQSSKSQQALSRHTGLQQDHRPNNPKRKLDFSNMPLPGQMPFDDSK